MLDTLHLSSFYSLFYSKCLVGFDGCQIFSSFSIIVRTPATVDTIAILFLKIKREDNLVGGSIAKKQYEFINLKVVRWGFQ